MPIVHLIAVNELHKNVVRYEQREVFLLMLSALACTLASLRFILQRRQISKEDEWLLQKLK